MISSSRSMLYRFFILYGSLYAGFGVQSPYLPILLDNHHLRPETIGLALAAGMAMRLMAAQAVARLADRLDAPKVILALCTTAAALIGLGYLPAQGAWLLIAVGVLHSAALAPLPPLTDTLALEARAQALSSSPSSDDRFWYREIAVRYRPVKNVAIRMGYSEMDYRPATLSDGDSPVHVRMYGPFLGLDFPF